MQRTLPLLLAISLFPLCGSSQVTIGQNDMPHANDDLVRSQAFVNPFINYAATGPAHLWDFSNLTVNTTDTAEYLTVASTNFVYAITYADIFFNPNRANHAIEGVDIAFNQFLPIADPYSFYYRSSSTYKKVGYGASIAGIPLPIIFDDHDEIYQLPIQFGDATSSFASYAIDLPGLGHYGFRQTRTNDVDGWGAITTPAGSFDVLRVKTTLAISDTIGVDSLGFGFAIDRPLVREYKWLTPGLRIPVLQINTTQVFGLEVVSAIYYYDVPRTLEVVQPLAATICPGATVSVPFEATGVYNAGGFLIQANHFTAQLSDANGDFSNPVVIGDIVATASGTITATIPVNTPLGSGYRIRVISTSPDHIGTDNGFDITIGGATTATISAGGGTMICTGDTVLLTAVGGPSYQWQRDGVDIAGATNEELAVDMPGSYTVMVDNVCGAATSNAIMIEVNTPPGHVLDTLSATICLGGSMQFIAHDTSGQAPVTYQWFLNNAPVPGALDTIMDASLPGTYTMQASNTNTGCIFTTEAATLIVESVPIPMVMALGDTIFCDGGSVLLDAEVVPGTTYQWYADMVAITGADSTTLEVDVAGSYFVELTNGNGCTSGQSISITVVVDSVPSVPIIFADGPISFCDSGSVVLSVDTLAGGTYQWSVNGIEVSGATQPLITADSTGTYSVEVTGTNGCSSASISSVDVTENAIPAMPVISASTDSLLASGSGMFQWYLDGVAIPGATDAFVVPTVNGNYTVTVTDPNGCSNTSQGYLWTTTGMLENASVQFNLYPNPTTGSFTLNMVVTEEAHYEIVDVAGKVIGNGKIIAPVTQIDAIAVSGVYMVRVMNSSGIAAHRLVVQ